MTRDVGERGAARRLRDDARDDGPAEPAWHEKTSTLAAASLAAVVVLALLYFLISTFVREFDDPEPVQQYFLDPTTSGSSRPSGSGTTTTQTITSTVPPATSDINPGDVTSTTDTSTSTRLPTTRRPSIGRDDDDDGPTTTRSRPRLNETRTLYPVP